MSDDKECHGANNKPYKRYLGSEKNLIDTVDIFSFNALEKARLGELFDTILHGVRVEDAYTYPDIDFKKYPHLKLGYNKTDFSLLHNNDNNAEIKPVLNFDDLEPHNEVTEMLQLWDSAFYFTDVDIDVKAVAEISDSFTELEGLPWPPKNLTVTIPPDRMDYKKEEKEGSSNETERKEENQKHVSDKEENEKDSEKKESDDEKESDEKESEDEKEMGLLDRPVEVTGCRARKQVERLEVSFALPTKDKQIPEGRGQKLGDCPRIEFQIAKHSVADLKPLHRVLFNRQGTANDTKKNIRKFSGFPFQDGSSDFEQKKDKVQKFSIPVLKGICEILDIERSGTKEDIVMRLLQFLVCPKDSGKALPKKKTSGRDKKNASKKKGKGNNKKSKAKDSDEEGDEETAISVDEASDASANEEEEEEPSDSETKKKSKAKSKKAPAKAKTVKKEKPKKEAKGTKRKKDIVIDDSSDSEPAEKKSKLPDDEDIKQLVKTILEEANLHEITMKKVIKQVYDTYPDCDLTDKKSFIKKTIKTV
ncbi:protein DEK isoform X2 [Parasteatoda tepidariorum]